jgi:hypothetical protein
LGFSAAAAVGASSIATSCVSGSDLTASAWETAADDSSAGVDSGVTECGISEVMRLDLGVYVVRVRVLEVKELDDAFAYSGRGRVWAAGMSLSAVPHYFLIGETITRHIASSLEQTFSTLLKTHLGHDLRQSSQPKRWRRRIPCPVKGGSQMTAVSMVSPGTW